MSNVEFNDEKEFKFVDKKTKNYFADFLIKSKIVKNQKTAEYVLVATMLIFFSLSIFIFVKFT